MKIHTKLNQNTKGFTILELLIATAVFSVVLLLCATAVVQVGQMFYKGVTINKTQDTTRKVINDIIGAIQYGEKTNSQFHQRSVSVSGGVVTECFGSVRYTYTLTQSLGTDPGQSRHVLWKDRVGASANCVLSPVDLTKPIPSPGGEELLGDNMRISILDVTVATGDAYQVILSVAYGATDDVFQVTVGKPDYSHCVGRNLGGQFCAVSSITSYATKRL